MGRGQKQFKQKFPALFSFSQELMSCEEVITGVLEEREASNNLSIFSSPHISNSKA